MREKDSGVLNAFKPSGVWKFPSFGTGRGPLSSHSQSVRGWKISYSHALGILRARHLKWLCLRARNFVRETVHSARKRRLALVSRQNFATPPRITEDLLFRVFVNIAVSTRCNGTVVQLSKFGAQTSPVRFYA